MELINQPLNGQLGNRLIELLGNEDYQTLNVLVAFAKNSGVLRLKEAIEKFRKRGGKVNVYVGVDLQGTSYEALVNLRAIVDSLFVVHAENSQTFHTKIYNFVGQDKSSVIVGSNNLTGGGLWSNFENSLLISFNKVSSESNLQDQVDQFIENLTTLGQSLMPITSQEVIDDLLEGGYVGKEVFQRINRQAEEDKRPKTSRLFGRGAPFRLPQVNGVNVPKNRTENIPARVEVLAEPEVKKILPTSNLTEDWQTIWMETRAMTGGSRNILDLSMRSLVEIGDPIGTPFEHEDFGYMKGGVEFFGMNPMETSVRKELILNFEGVDYSENEILYPEGSKANGTWRLQIKGKDSLGRKITEAFKAKGEEHYLVQKIVTFTRVHDDFYFMSVFPATDLESFIKSSKILARNGGTAASKYLGLL